MNLIEKLKILVGWKKIVILVIDDKRGVIHKHWATDSDKYMVRSGKYNIFIDYNNEKVEFKRIKP